MASMHVVFATFGSLGDLFPLLAVGQELAAHGHRVTVAAHAIHREMVRAAGLGFVDASGMEEPGDKVAFTRRAFHPWRGPRFVVHDCAACDVAASYARLKPLCEEADVLVTSTLAFAGQILGEQLEAAGWLRWLSVVLAPASFISVFDPLATGIAPLDRLVRAAPGGGRVLRWAALRRTHGWTAPVRQFRRRLGLPAVSPLGDPFHSGQHAPSGVLALWPELLGPPQPDWPEQVHLTGFARYAQPGALDPDLLAFLDVGPPPLVFSLGSTAVHMGGDFLRQSLDVAARLKRRAVLFTGTPELRAQLPVKLPPYIFAVEYAPHAALFPRAEAIIHHGGIGTSAAALHAGRPMLVVPHGFDQPDNGARLLRLGVAQVLPAGRYRVDPAAAALQQLLESDAPARARAVALALAGNEGAATAARWIEASFPARAGGQAVQRP